MQQLERIFEGIVLDEGLSLSLVELCMLCDAEHHLIECMVAEGLLNPCGNLPAEWRFDGVAVRRARRAVRLRHDLDLNLAGTALALDLLEENERLRERLQVLEQHLAQPGTPR
ncbi:chaperone modulator CbpM [Marichromatium bheemlicum]|uniref:MerR family transcriptional regulator n=1 Tax=Marichromatium bheemlicum TaxID=365339 RepID=A0ABX1I8Z3_9GAMM|nr:chaperone modulator CbpM [Marichromatium bheemlicum]NKN33992.1 MerR family transcriptional regulator [Marichromatium bheemlicum]